MLSALAVDLGSRSRGMQRLVVVGIVLGTVACAAPGESGQAPVDPPDATRDDAPTSTATDVSSTTSVPPTDAETGTTPTDVTVPSDAPHDADAATTSAPPDTGPETTSYGPCETGGCLVRDLTLCSGSTGYRVCQLDAERACLAEGPFIGCAEHNTCVDRKCQGACVRPEILFAIDRSASAESTWALTTAGLSDFLPRIEHDVRVGARFFPADGCTPGELVPIAGDNAAAITQRFTSPTVGGSTPIAAALADLAPAFGDPNQGQHTIVISDGSESCASVGDVMRSVDALVHRGIRVHTIGVGASYDGSLLAAVAQRGGGRFFAAADRPDFDEALHALLTVAVGCDAGAAGLGVCVDGTCDARCDPGFHACDGVCVADLDVRTCLGCEPCPGDLAGLGTAICTPSGCGLDCPLDHHPCGGRCVPSNAPATCDGACAPCPGDPHGDPVCGYPHGGCGIACDPGYHGCNVSGGTRCADDTSVASCGDRCSPCPGPAVGEGWATCEDERCTIACAEGHLACGDLCAWCGEPRAAATFECSGAACVIATCDPGYHLCNGGCSVCPAASGVASFGCGISGACQIAACAPGHRLCDGLCRACPSEGVSTTTCAADTCIASTCEPGWKACGGACAPCPDLDGGVMGCVADQCVLTCPLGQHVCEDGQACCQAALAEEVVMGQNIGDFPTIALEPGTDVPYVSYRSLSGIAVRRRDASGWASYTSFSATYAGQHGIDFREDGTFVAVYRSYYDLKMISGKSTFTTVTLASSVTPTSIAMVIDRDGHARVAYFSSPTSTSYWYRLIDVWLSGTILVDFTDTDAFWGAPNDLAVSDTGAVHALYWDDPYAAPGEALRHVRRTTGATYTASAIPGGSEGHAVAIGPDGVRFAYRKGSQGLFYARETTNGLVEERVASAQPWQVELVTAPEGAPVVLWAHNGLFIAERFRGIWHVSQLDTEVSDELAARFDGQGRLHLVYYRLRDQSVRYVRLDHVTAELVDPPDDPDPPAPDGDVLLTEVVEGSGNSKALEITNRTAQSKWLSSCALSIYANGSSTPFTKTLPDVQLARGESFVYCHTESAPALLARCDATDANALSFNGDDAIALVCGADVDIVGQIGMDPGAAWTGGGVSTANTTLRRKCDVVTGDGIADNPFDPSIQWVAWPVDTFDGLGDHCP